MTSATFRVVTRGLQPGHSAEITAELVAKLFKCSKEQIAPLLGSKAVTVKRGLALDAATKYAQALTRCGCVCAVEPDIAKYLALSDARLHRIEPKLYDLARWANQADRASWMDAIRATLGRGDSRAVVVVDAADSVVASYARELDCAVLLRFDPGFGLVHGWQNGTRLLGATSYVSRDHGVASDLQPGPGDTGRWGNAWPLVADLLTDDHAGLAARKRAIEGAEWDRAWALGRSVLAGGGIPRDGRPLGSRQPAPLPAATPVPASRWFAKRSR